eukprot:GEMP01037822.1.p1 GENE.GEMP01037822.1~~GEMP01037822.1.p1  ORF type:complete len:308 (+),score=85.12 GEMP01037822.1:108-1031(+)
MLRRRESQEGAAAGNNEPKARPPKIYCGKVPQKFAEDELKDLCRKYGDVHSFFYMEDCSGFEAGWFLALFDNMDQAKAAIAGLQATYNFETRLSMSNSFAGGNQLPASQQAAMDKEAEPALLAARTAAQTEQKAREEKAREEKSSEPPQRGNWREYATKDGHKYYFNVETRVTTWEKPIEFQTPVQPPAPVLPLITIPKVVLPPGAGPIGTGVGPPGANLFVYHVPFTWVEAEFAQHFASFGKIVAARIFRDDLGMSKGFGFISYDHPQCAIQAIHAMNGFMVDGKELKVSIKKGEEQYLTAMGNPV